MSVDFKVKPVAAERLRPFGPRVRLVHGDYRQLPSLARAAALGPFDGILLDQRSNKLSPQLES